MTEFLTHMPANTVIFITMAVLGLMGMLIVLRRLIEGVPTTAGWDPPGRDYEECIGAKKHLVLALLPQTG
jgi:hypothetical protein